MLRRHSSIHRILGYHRSRRVTDIVVCVRRYRLAHPIEELIESIRERYGLVINGLEEKRFSNADLQTHLAFKENVEAFKTKLRQIGFYSDLSDAYILQRIRPRYQLNAQ